jgi:uncharacterized protein (TIGR03435 family)
MKIVMATLMLLLVTPAGPRSQQQIVFEVASVKPSAQDSPVAGSSTQDPGFISYRHVPLKLLLMRAYGVKYLQISGPDWLDTQFYDLNAKLPAGATAGQVPAMLQQLLTDRFQMTLRWDTRQTPGYALIVDKGGPKLKLSADQTAHDGDRPDTARSNEISNVVELQGAPMVALTNVLSGILGEPVADSTGLQGRYDVVLKVSFADFKAARQGPSPSASDDGGYTPATVFDAVRDLGLRLQPQKTEVKYLTVVKANRVPTEN